MTNHPIPGVTVIDVTVGLAGGGADYGLVIARPLRSDKRSLKRLQAKMENYVSDFYSSEAARQYGIHKDSDPEIFDRMKEYEEWVRSKSIEFSLKRIENP